MDWLTTLLKGTQPCTTCCWQEILFTGMCTECTGDLSVETLRDLLGGKA